jgi:energy-coupling factor transport system substrate-specific component
METDYTPLKREGRNPYAVAAGSALLYGLLNFFSNTFLLPSAPIIALRPQVVLPMFVGLIYGPSPGFVVGMCGNLIGDTLFGYGVIQFWHWHIANGLLGMFAGFLKRSR